MEKSPLSNKKAHASAQVGSPEKLNLVSPKKLLLSKWTAVCPQRKEKHFLVVTVVEPETLGSPIIEVDIEAAMTGRVQRMPWRDLKDATKWLRGWL